MRRLTRKNIFLIIAILLIIYLLFANNIILRLFTDNPLLRQVSVEDFPRTSAAFSRIYFNPLNDMFDSFSLVGWAFAEADYQENKTVNLVLRGVFNDRFYSAPMVLWPRPQLLEYFADYGIRIAGTMHHLTGDFSTILLPDDIYEVYIHSKENENEAGWARTGIIFEVYNSELAAFNPQSRNFTNAPTYDGWIHGFVDRFEIVDNVLTISGFFVRPGFDTLFRTLWIELTNADGDIVTFLASSFIRDDVADHFYEPLYRYSGYHAVIPLDVLNNCESLTLAFIVENNGVFYRHVLP